MKNLGKITIAVGLAIGVTSATASMSTYEVTEDVVEQQITAKSQLIDWRTSLQEGTLALALNTSPSGGYHQGTYEANPTTCMSCHGDYQSSE